MSAFQPGAAPPPPGGMMMQPGGPGPGNQPPATNDPNAPGAVGQDASKQQDPKPVESSSSFQVMVTGELEGAQLGSSGRGPLMCVFSFQCGNDWSVVQGHTQGITQLATSAHPTTKVSGLFHGDPREVVWNFPLGVTYKTTNAFGWPRLIVSVYGTDLCNRRVIKGYGSIHVPCSPGRHERIIRLFRPISSSWLVRFLGWLLGSPAQFVDPRIIGGTDGREVVRVQSGGKVKVVFNVLSKGHKDFNYDLGGA